MLFPACRDVVMRVLIELPKFFFTHYLLYTTGNRSPEMREKIYNHTESRNNIENLGISVTEQDEIVSVLMYMVI